MKQLWRILLILTVSSANSYCQEPKDFFKNAKNLLKEADSLSNYNTGNPFELYKKALFNFDKEIERNPLNYDAYFYAAKTSRHIEWLKDRLNVDPTPTYPYYLKLYQVIIQNPKKQISLLFTNREILFELSSLFSKNKLQQAIFFMEEAKKVPYTGKSYWFTDLYLNYKLGDLYYFYAKEKKELLQYSSASFNYTQAMKYLQKHISILDDETSKKMIRFTINDCALQVKICKILAANPRWRPFMVSNQYDGISLVPTEMQDNDFLIIYDSETLKFSNEIITVWIRNVYIGEEKKSSLNELKIFMNFNISTDKFRMAKMYFYNKNNTLLKTIEDDNWEDVLPDTQFETMLLILKERLKLK